MALVVDGAHTETGVAPVKESDVYERIKEAISGQDGLIVADFDAMDMERLLTFNAIAEMTRRQLVLSLADAHMINAMGIVWRQFPAFDAVDTFCILNAPQFDDSPNGWEEELRDQFQAILVTPEELRANGGDYILRTSPSELEAVEAGGPRKRRLHPLAGGNGRGGWRVESGTRRGAERCRPGLRGWQLFPFVRPRDV